MWKTRITAVEVLFNDVIQNRASPVSKISLRSEQPGEDEDGCLTMIAREILATPH